MATNTRLGNCQAMLERMQEATEAKISLPAPFKNAKSLNIYKKTVKDGRSVLPLRYQRPYVDVLEQALNQAEAVLKTLGSKPNVKRQALMQQLELVFSALAAPVVQLSSKEHARELKAFLAVVSDVYQHVLDAQEFRATAKPSLLWPSLDPLASFDSDRYSDPHTFPATAELPVALISKPASHSSFVPFWLIDGHEVGGHAIFANVDGFQAQLNIALEAAIRKAFASGELKPRNNTVTFSGSSGAVFNLKTTVSLEDFFCTLWKQWLCETSADAAGLLNMGPMFVNGLILSLSVQRPSWDLSTKSVFDSRKGFTDHPTEVVRALLAIEMLRQSAAPQSASSVKALRKRLDDIQGDLPSRLSWFNRTGTTAAEIDFADMLAILPVVANTILNAKLDCLSGQSLRGLMPWSETDDLCVRSVAAALLRGKGVVPDSAQARHVVSGAMLAVERASMFAGFDVACADLHKNALNMLNELYSNQCLLCNVQSLRNGAKDPKEVSLKDLVKLVKNMRGR